MKNNPTNYVDPSGEFFNPMAYIREKSSQAREWANRQVERVRSTVRNSPPVKDFRDTRTQMQRAFPGEDNIGDAQRHAHTNEALVERYPLSVVEGAGVWNEVQGIDAIENRGGTVNWRLTVMDIHNNQIGNAAGLLPDFFPFGTIETHRLLVYKPYDYLRYYQSPSGGAPW